MFETMASFMLVEHANGALFIPARARPITPALWRQPQALPTKDGYIAALIYNDKHWAAFVDAVQPPWAGASSPPWRSARTRSTRSTACWPRPASARPRNGSTCCASWTSRPPAPHARRAVRQPAPERGRILRDRRHASTGRCAFPVCRRGSRERRAGSRARRVSWVRIRGRAATNSDLIRPTSSPRWVRDKGHLRGLRNGPGCRRRCARKLRDLVDAHVPEDFLGAFTDDPADLEFGPAVLPAARRTRACSAWPGPRSSAAAGPRSGSRPWCARRCGRTTSRAARSTWASTGSGRRSCGTAPPSSSARTCRRSRAARSSGARASASRRRARTSRRCAPRPAATATAGCITGQKIWTSYATMAQWCFLLARTHKGEKKQQGLTIFLVPMADPAIEVRPIRCMMGPHHLNEVFFDDLRVTDADVLGTVDEGWSDRAGRAVLRAGRHRPLRAVRTTAAVRRRSVSAIAGTDCPPSCAAAGRAC